MNSNLRQFTRQVFRPCAGIVIHAIPPRTRRLPLARRNNKLDPSMRPAPRKNCRRHARFPTPRSDPVPPVSLRFKAHCALLACSFFWGVTFVVVKNALADISVFALPLGAFPARRPADDLDLPRGSAEPDARRSLGRRPGGAVHGRRLRVSNRRDCPHDSLESRLHHRIERGARAHISCRLLAQENRRVGLGRRGGLLRWDFIFSRCRWKGFANSIAAMCW